jgi:uncharacterized protein with PIN domain
MSDFAMCECGVKMIPNNFGCKYKYVIIRGLYYKRVLNDEAACGDCNVRLGATHHLNCDMERCPKCGGQLISCDCGLVGYSKVVK